LLSNLQSDVIKVVARVYFDLEQSKSNAARNTTPGKTRSFIHLIVIKDRSPGRISLTTTPIATPKKKPLQSMWSAVKKNARNVQFTIAIKKGNDESN
jgi:hypothetical protein